MRVGDQERDIVARDRFPPQHNKVLGTLHHEARKLVRKDMLDLVCLLDLDAQTHTVHRGLNQHDLVFIPADGQRRKDHLGRRLRLDFGDIVALDDLRRKVFQRQRSSERRAHALQVRPQCIRLGQCTPQRTMVGRWFGRRDVAAADRHRPRGVGGGEQEGVWEPRAPGYAWCRRSKARASRLGHRAPGHDLGRTASPPTTTNTNTNTTTTRTTHAPYAGPSCIASYTYSIVDPSIITSS